MRIRIVKIVTVSIITLNLVGLYFFCNLFGQQKTFEKQKHYVIEDSRNEHYMKSLDDLIQDSVTVIFREFENFENDVPNTIRSITSTYPNISILVVSNGLPYPPLFFNSSNYLFHKVKHVYLQLGLNNSFKARTPILQLNTRYALFMPDSARIHTKKTIEKMFKILNDQGRAVVAATFKATKPVVCLNTHINSKEWVIQFEESSDGSCEFVKGKHALLFRTELLKELTDSFMLPFPEAFYIQAAAKGLKVSDKVIFMMFYKKDS